MTATISIDKAGRMVLPKVIREKLQLRAGSKIKVEVCGDKIEMTPDFVEGRVERRADGLPVIVGWERFDAARAVEEAREEYLDRQAGIDRDES